MLYSAARMGKEFTTSRMQRVLLLPGTLYISFHFTWKWFSLSFPFPCLCLCHFPVSAWDTHHSALCMRVGCNTSPLFSWSLPLPHPFYCSNTVAGHPTPSRLWSQGEPVLSKPPVMDTHAAGWECLQENIGGGGKCVLAGSKQ